MNWLDETWDTLKKLRNAKEYVQDIEYLLWAEEQDEKSMLSSIDYITTKYRIWIDEIGSLHNPAIHVTTSQEEYEDAYHVIMLEDCIAQCEYLIECIIIGASVRVGMYATVVQALRAQKEEK